MSAEKRLETIWINGWVDTGDCDLTISADVESMLLSAKLDLADVTYGLRTGMVVHSDMDESKGRWVVHCHTIDGDAFLLTILVNSNEYEVEVLYVETFTGNQRS